MPVPAVSPLVVNTLRAQFPQRASWCPLALQLTAPDGFWVRVHPGCALPEVLFRIHARRAERVAA